MNDTKSAVNNGYSQTFGKGLRVLAALRAHQDGLAVGTIATEVGVHRTVVYRLLGTLRAHGLITQESDGRFRLGLGLIELAGGVHTNLRQAAHPHLAALADEVTATAFLTLADGDEAISANVVPPRNSKLHVGYRAGLRHPLEVSAAGVAILAHAPHNHTNEPQSPTPDNAVTQSPAANSNPAPGASPPPFPSRSPPASASSHSPNSTKEPWPERCYAPPRRSQQYSPAEQPRLKRETTPPAWPARGLSHHHPCFRCWLFSTFQLSASGH